MNKDIDRRKIPPETLKALGWEVVCLLEEMKRTEGDGVVQMNAAEGLPATRFAVRVLDAPN
jgi:hypothetical protein